MLLFLYRAIHEDCDCKTYQRRLQEEAETSEDAKKTQQFLDVSVISSAPAGRDTL